MQLSTPQNKYLFDLAGLQSLITSLARAPAGLIPRKSQDRKFKLPA
jgi:hypothetical protein